MSDQSVARARSWGLLRAFHVWTMIARLPIPALGVAAGDLVLFRPSPLRNRERTAIGAARLRRIRRSDLSELRAHLSHFDFPSCRPGLDRTIMANHLATSARRGGEETTNFWVLSFAWVSRPIEAASDEAAIFELLSQEGGRMPSQEEEV